MAKWMQRWMRIALDSDSDQVRIIETSDALHWDTNKQHYSFEPDGKCEVRGERYQSLLLPSLSGSEWTACIDGLGEEGWELVGIASLAPDARLKRVGGGEAYNAQLWAFKRQLGGPEAATPAEGPTALELEGSEADRLEQATPAWIDP